jgi:hypothetical protein
MKHFIIVPSVLALALVGALAAPAHANGCDRLTYLTFSAPVTLPGITLPAGTYKFTRPDCEYAEGLLRVASVDGTKVYGTFLTIPEQRLSPSSRPEVDFAEMPSGSPEAIKAWFYPGQTTGDELIYPKNQAANVAEAPVQEVFATKRDIA